jgi:3'-5' exoribonuclease
MLPHDAALVTAAALLHDVGKVATLPRVAGGALPEEGFQLDHVTRGVLMTQVAAAHLSTGVSEERLANLLHAIAAHHGTREWGAPVEPRSVEAWLVHVADVAEARLWQWSEEA